MACGLEAIHGIGVVHCDVKPENILLIGGTAKLADFGTVRIAPTLTYDSHMLTRNIVGTGPYMPPEYALSGRVGAKTDTYAFGVVLAELMTSKPAADPQTRQLLVDELAPALENPKALLAPFLDARAGAWDARRARQLAAVVYRCVEREHYRCVVADIVGEVDELAGRGARRKGGGLWSFGK